MRVLVVEPLAREGLELLAAEHQVDLQVGLDRAALLAVLPGCQALIVRSQVQVDAEVIAAGRDLRVIGRAGVGLDNVDVAAAARAGVVVVNAPAGNTIAAAEHTIGLLFAVARQIPAADASLRRGEWRRSSFGGVELTGRTMGILGLGRIGLAVADRASGIGMPVVGHDPFVAAQVAATHAIGLLEFDEMLGRAQVLTVHVPGGAATRGLVGARELALLPAGAIVLNVARGGVVDEEALSQALRSGHLGGAGVDVFDAEPPFESPLLAAPRTVLTPHLGASTAEAQVRVAVETAQKVLEALADTRDETPDGAGATSGPDPAPVSPQ